MGKAESKPKDEQTQNEVLPKPWREFDWSDTDELRMKLENFSLSKSEVKKIKILVAGPVGAGKSSFINSINSAFHGRISSRALASATDASRSFTSNLKEFVIKTDKYDLPYVFVDIMGLQPGSVGGAQPEDIINATLGHIKDGYKFDQEKPLSFKDPQFNTDPGLSDTASCLVYVFNANTVQLIEDPFFDKLKAIRSRISQKGIPQVIALTRIDKACPLVKEDLKMVYRSKKIKQKIEMCSHKVGVPMCNIFPVKNYQKEINTNNIVDVLILKALEQIVQFADDRLQDSTECKITPF